MAFLRACNCALGSACNCALRNTQGSACGSILGIICLDNLSALSLPSVFPQSSPCSRSGAIARNRPPSLPLMNVHGEMMMVRKGRWAHHHCGKRSRKIKSEKRPPITCWVQRRARHRNTPAIKTLPPRKHGRHITASCPPASAVTCS